MCTLICAQLTTKKRHNRNEKQLIADSVKLLYINGGKRCAAIRIVFIQNVLKISLPLNGALHLVCVNVAVSCAHLHCLAWNVVELGVCVSPIHWTQHFENSRNFVYVHSRKNQVNNWFHDLKDHWSLCRIEILHDQIGHRIVNQTKKSNWIHGKCAARFGAFDRCGVCFDGSDNAKLANRRSLDQDYLYLFFSSYAQIWWRRQQRRWLRRHAGIRWLLFDKPKNLFTVDYYCVVNGLFN